VTFGGGRVRVIALIVGVSAYDIDINHLYITVPTPAGEESTTSMACKLPCQGGILHRHVGIIVAMTAVSEEGSLIESG